MKDRYPFTGELSAVTELQMNLVCSKFDLNRYGGVNGQDYAFLLANQQAAGIVAPITTP